MPVSPNMPNAKPTTMKTERTHEENQERAYIAASRRSDRSLEARVESARRASEIHKRRTGRALRVTEQDVLNEEMYEEEEDDLPLPYRQLTQHLTTGSAEFNRRLAAYLTNHVAVRSALDQIIRDSHTLSANAAAVGATSYPVTGDFGMQQATFSPTAFATPFHPGVPMTPDQSNPPTPSSMGQKPQPQINMAQLQSSGTQFHIGPLGLSTVPQPQYPYIRRQTAPQLQIPQTAPHGLYQSLSPSQLQSLNQGQMPARSQVDGNVQSSPRSDTTMLSPQAIRSAITPDNKLNPPEMLNARRMSMPAKVSASPVQAAHSRPTIASAQNSSASAPVSSSSPSALKQNKSLSAIASPVVAAKSEPEKAKSASPTLKRKASDELPVAQSTKTSKQADGRTSTKFTPSSVDLGPLDLSLPQNAQELLYGGLNMTDMMNMSVMPSMNHYPAGGRVLKLDEGQLKGKGFPHPGPQLVPTPPLGKFGESMQDGMNYFGNIQSLGSFPDGGDYDLSSLMMETGGNTFGTSFSKLDPLDGGNVDDLWQDFFSSDNFNKSSQEAISSQQNQNVEAPGS